jgi:Holliday junction resolvase RusA-like endonuclease
LSLLREIVPSAVEGEYQIVLPWPCLVPDNRRFISTRGHVLTSRYRQAKDLSATLAIAQTKAPYPHHKDNGVWLRLNFFMPDKRRRDPNNLLKAICDALEGVVYTDDKQITDLCWKNAGLDRHHPRVEISYGEDG